MTNEVEHNMKWSVKDEEVMIWETQMIQQLALLQNENLVLTENLGKA